MRVFLFLWVVVCPALLLAENPRDAEVGRIFQDIYPRLEKTLGLVNEQKELPNSSWFGSDKADKQEDIDELLTSAVGALELPDIARYREDILSAEQKISDSRARIAEYRRAKLGAPKESSLGLDNIPFLTTQKGYDSKIESEEEAIERYSHFIEETQLDFLSRVQSLGIDISAEQFEILLSTINGEDFLQMSLAFETIKGITDQLQLLTEQSKEDVETARRYYGMYTVLLRILNHMQQKFMGDIEEKHLPQLKKFEETANANIEEAREAIKSGGDRELLEQNIESNTVTLRALDLYRDYLKQQKREIAALNKTVQGQILTADNTYNTVRLASELVRVLQSNVKNFEALKKLKPPHLSGFENQKLKEEISKLTGLMQSQ
ncbi:MAG: hypothetical protein KDD64_14340 [Bdellovibrionales bacterium]|nr:hypothetical protein [Bdellovibrionales bacterium]